jgi:restriction endonuclease S subunit
MTEKTRAELVKILNDLDDLINVTNAQIMQMEALLEKDDDILKDLEDLKEDKEEHEKDISIYCEMLDILNMNEAVDTRTCDYDYTYDSWDEVLTGGDY